MKKHICALTVLLLSIGFMSCSSSKSTVQGSWMLTEENGYPVDRKQIKHYTEKNFIWHTMDRSNIIIMSGAGEYRLNKDELYEDITMTTSGNRNFKGRTAKIKLKMKKDTLFQNTTIPMGNGNNEFTEKWVRISK